jgi:transcriptional regulator with XRE-family HTH domain
MRWEDQVTPATRKVVSTGSIFDDWKLQSNDEVLLFITRLADSTNDGGVLIDSNSPIAWGIYRDNNHIVKILPEVNLKFEGIIRHVDHSLSLHQTSVELPLDAIHWMESVTGLSQDRIGRLIGVTRQAINGWKRGGRIADDNRQRIFAIRDVLERAISKHPTKDLLTAWLDTPRGADGRTPAQLIEANEVNRARLLAISSPSPRLVRAPTWVNQPIPEAFSTGAERRQEVLPPNTDDELSQLLDKEENDTGEDGEVLPLI